MGRTFKESSFMEQEMKRQKLLTKGMNKLQTDVLFSRCSSEIVDLFVNLSDGEWQQLTGLFTLDELLKKSETCRHIKTLILIGGELKRLGYAPYQILRVAEYVNGEKT